MQQQTEVPIGGRSLDQMYRLWLLMSRVMPSPDSVPFADSHVNVTGVLTKKRAALRSMANFRYFGASDEFAIGGAHHF
jgi:hypothetical protein